MKSAVALSRRSLLGLAALALAGCKRGSSASARRIDPDAAALGAARATELALIAACALAGEVDEQGIHQAHLAALGGRVTSPSSSPSSPPTAAPAAAIKPILRTSATSLRAAAAGAFDGEHAALFASIAASHEVLGHV